MKERPILFSGEMVRALLDGRKTQTRRIAKRNCSGRVELKGHQWHIEDPEAIKACPYGQPGDRLWVKETFGIHRGCPPHPKWQHPGKGWLGYRADESGCPTSLIDKWKPSIFMPRWASRITLEITAVRVERLQDISEKDALAEGITWPDRDGKPYRPPIDLTGMSKLGLAAERYKELWESINGKGSWEKNPFVWAITFKKL